MNQKVYEVIAEHIILPANQFRAKLKWPGDVRASLFPYVAGTRRGIAVVRSVS